MKNLLITTVVALTLAFSSGVYAENVYMYKNADGVMEFSGTKQRSKAVVKEDKLHKTSDSVKRVGVQRMAEVNAYNAEYTKKYEAKMQARYESAQLDKQDKMREREVKAQERQAKALFSQARSSWYRNGYK